MSTLRPSKTGLIYGLVDPRSLCVRYIGKTWLGSRRPQAHKYKSVLKKDRTRRAAWVKSLLALGLDYKVVELELCSYDQTTALEVWWISYGRALGWDLTNHTDGGEGMLGHVPTSETRRKISVAHADRVFTEQHRARISEAKKGVPKTEEHKAKLSAAAHKQWEDPKTLEIVVAANVGRKQSPETLAKRSAAMTGRKQSAETVAKRALSMTGKKHTAEAKANMSAAQLAARARKLG